MSDPKDPKQWADDEAHRYDEALSPLYDRMWHRYWKAADTSHASEPEPPLFILAQSQQLQATRATAGRARRIPSEVRIPKSWFGREIRIHFDSPSPRSTSRDWLISVLPKGTTIDVRLSAGIELIGDFVGISLASPLRLPEPTLRILTALEILHVNAK